MSLPFPHELHPVFRRMTLPDLDALMTIEEVSFPTPWSLGTYRRELTRSRYGSYWVVTPRTDANSDDAHHTDTHHTDADDNDADGNVPRLLAYGGMWRTPEEAHITTIAVHPQWRRRGLGEWTLLQLIGVARAGGAEIVTLEVRVSNEAAIRLYRKLGFEAVGTRRGYYIDTREDALLMTLFGIQDPARWQQLQQARVEIERRVEGA